MYTGPVRRPSRTCTAARCRPSSTAVPRPGSRPNGMRGAAYSSPRPAGPRQGDLPLPELPGAGHALVPRPRARGDAHQRLQRDGGLLLPPRSAERAAGTSRAAPTRSRWPSRTGSSTRTASSSSPTGACRDAGHARPERRAAQPGDITRSGSRSSSGRRRRERLAVAVLPGRAAAVPVPDPRRLERPLLQPDFGGAPVLRYRLRRRVPRRAGEGGHASSSPRRARRRHRRLHGGSTAGTSPSPTTRPSPSRTAICPAIDQPQMANVMQFRVTMPLTSNDTSCNPATGGLHASAHAHGRAPRRTATGNARRRRQDRQGAAARAEGARGIRRGRVEIGPARGPGQQHDARPDVASAIPTIPGRRHRTAARRLDRAVGDHQPDRGRPPDAHAPGAVPDPEPAELDDRDGYSGSGRRRSRQVVRPTRRPHATRARPTGRRCPTTSRTRDGAWAGTPPSAVFSGPVEATCRAFPPRGVRLEGHGEG